MRLKALLRYRYKSAKLPLAMFFLWMSVGALSGSLISGLSIRASGATPGQSFGVTAIGFVIFATVYGILDGLTQTDFLLCRSVARKEASLSNLLFLPGLAAVLSLLQIVLVFADGLVRRAVGLESGFRGISLDAQAKIAPNADRPLVFFCVSFAWIAAFAAFGLVMGVLLARWKRRTLGVCVLCALLSGTLLLNSKFGHKIFEIFRYLILDDRNGLAVAGKHLISALILSAVYFVLSRRQAVRK